ncbi:MULTISPECIES: DUF6305 family protein [Fusobacterium]|uniref:DUF6305 family protein n=1 Tax=Fusobacterium TaxID=848 RepID=UPI001F4F14F0|nr:MULTISPECIES: DUF6305 family protein [Fusobacterium]MCI5725173.1 DUF6305 family protein [Fusobacterium sp.]MDD7410670.1 DUF6305 family protein [Fusobacteriaceae bacterium]MDY5305125.1 DUF6305 family protein [Fusobacterium gastrosuis]MDY5714258.1 DUF6305 family protein [Fusobacterium gastrosuis]
MKKIFTSVLFIILSIGVFAAKFEKPILLTSVGQSADVQMVKALLKKGNIEAEFDKSVKAEDLKGQKTVILAIGGSSKGLGAAGIKAEDEIARVEKLIKAAKSKGMKLIGMHIGGAARRGELSDKFVYVAAPYVDYLIVVSEGNKDGVFTKISADKKIQMDEVDKVAGALDPLKKAFE